MAVLSIVGGKKKKERGQKKKELKQTNKENICKVGFVDIVCMYARNEGSE